MLSCCVLSYGTLDPGSSEDSDKQVHSLHGPRGGAVLCGGDSGAEGPGGSCLHHAGAKAFVNSERPAGWGVEVLLRGL